MPETLPALVWYIFICIMSVCGFLAIWVLSKIDRNQTELFNRMQGVEGRLSKLEGAHDVMMEMGGHNYGKAGNK
jgi:hypothetical protein